MVRHVAKMLRHALTSTRSPLPRRGLASAAEGAEGGWGAWFQHRKDGFVKVFLSGTAMCLAMHAVNLRNSADEAQAEMMEQLRASTAARKGIVQRAPSLAREMGLPAGAEATATPNLDAKDLQIFKTNMHNTI